MPCLDDSCAGQSTLPIVISRYRTLYSFVLATKDVDGLSRGEILLASDTTLVVPITYAIVRRNVLKNVQCTYVAYYYDAIWTGTKSKKNKYQCMNVPIEKYA